MFKQRRALKDPPAFESPGSRDSSQELLEEAKISPPEVEGFDPAYRPASSTQDPELHHFIHPYDTFPLGTYMLSVTSASKVKGVTLPHGT